MKVVVIGGTGLIGSKLVTKLVEHGHDAVPAAPNTGVNTLTGEGLAEALAGADVVVDVSNSPSFEDTAVMQFFETSTRNILDAEAAAGVGHHVALSVVGTERLAESGYFRAKTAQEKLIKSSAIPYSIVHATQFFEFLKSIADAATEGDTVRLAPVFIQPMAADDVAAAVDKVAVAAPINGTVEVGRTGTVPARRSRRPAVAGARRPARGRTRRTCALLRCAPERAHTRSRRRRPTRPDTPRRLAQRGPGAVTMAGKASKKPTKSQTSKAAKPVLLAGGNPQIAKGEGDAPVKAYIAAMPGWKRDVGRRLDALIVRTVPDVHKAVKWNSPFYGVEGQGWFLNFHCYTNYVKVAFFRGLSLRPVPPGESKSGDTRYLDIREDDELDEARVARWIKQASKLPGEHL